MHIYNKPMWLFVRGTLPEDAKPSAAVIGGAQLYAVWTTGGRVFRPDSGRKRRAGSERHGARGSIRRGIRARWMAAD